MKRLTLTIALLAAFAAHAQDSTSSGTASSSSSSNPVANNAGIGNSTSSGSAIAASQSGTSGNNQGVTLNFGGGGGAGTPSAQAFNADGTPRDGRDANGFAVVRNINEGTSTQRLEGGTTNSNTDNIKYSGTIENRASGGQYNVIETRGTTTVKMAPAIAMSGPASGPCTGVSGGVGLSGPGWGVGFNGSTVMDDCRMRENTRVLGMAMQSLDGQANPQEKGEVTVIFMDAVRNLGAYNNTIYQRVAKENK
jgi:hypothetical protein